MAVLRKMISSVFLLSVSSLFIPFALTYQTFILETCSATNPLFDGLYVTTFHTGAGFSAAAVTTGRDLAPPFNQTTYPSNSTDKYIELAEAQYPFTLTLYDDPPYEATSAAIYRLVDVDIGYRTPGFYLDYNDIVRYSGKNLSFGTFAVCYEPNGIAPYFSLGGQQQLLWRDGVAVDNNFTGPGCGDVELRAAPF